MWATVTTPVARSDGDVSSAVVGWEGRFMGGRREERGYWGI